MAFRTWAKLLGTTLGVAALAGASQLGLAYGLGILRLTRVVEVAARDQWTAQLAWVAWFAMSAAVLGALAGRWLRDRWRAPATPGTFVALSLAAGLGAALVVPLTMQPARTARVDGVHPVFVIGICATLGAAVGVFAAYAALTQLIARRSLTVIGIAVWVLALLSVAPSLGPDDPLPAVRLGVFDAGYLSPEVTQRTALFTMPALALVTGAILGYAARRRDLPILTIALAGLPGPALLTLSYLIAGPGAGADRYQVVPYWAAMTATGAGVLGSVLAAVIRRAPDDLGDDDAAAASGRRSRPDDGDGDRDEPAAAIGTGRRSRPDEPTSPPGSGRPAGGDDDEPTGPIPVQRPATDSPGRHGSPTDPNAYAAAGPPPRAAAGPSGHAAGPPAHAAAGPPGHAATGSFGQAADGPSFGGVADEPPAAPKRPARRGRAARKPAPPDIFEMSPGDSTEAFEPSTAGGRPATTGRGIRRGRRNAPAAPSEPPYVPAPALPEIPPEALQPQRRAVNTDATQDRLRGAPLVPEPHAISAPLAQPEPTNPPPPMRPAPEKKSKRQAKEEEYVDWVSKLSNE
ncbi:hypothetical protein AB0M54_25965 [Actinoplanes sp. NPDC051470]|uniref:hypothetical protein n=1 Tax=Actinoplanes sp. NPDC051470 TaxID=3157224 RepID=UPI0034217339